jgi:hypothetical protein
MKALPILTAAILLTACGNTTTPAQTVTVTPTQTSATAQAMSEWKRGAADEIHTMGDAMTSIGDAMQHYDLPTMRVNCTRLRTSVDHLERQLPSPDTQVNDALQDTIDDFRALAQLCMTVTPTSDTELNEMGRLINRGGQRMSEAFDLMK